MFVDFDGTLAPIVDDPAEARPWPSVPELLSRLADRWGRVAVVSGRPVAYLVSRLQGAGATELFGLYGMERVRREGAPQETEPAADSWRAVVSGAADAAERRVPPGVAVERKGLSLTLHFRAVPNEEEWVSSYADGLAAATGLVAHAGKMSVELRPPVDTDKGTVVRDLGADLEAVLFVGDDRGDLPAFAELKRMRGSGKATLGVAAAGRETPADVLSAADVVVDGPGGVVGLLERVAAG